MKKRIMIQRVVVLSALFVCAAGESPASAQSLGQRLRARLDVSNTRLAPEAQPRSGNERVDVDGLVAALRNDEPVPELATPAKTKEGKKTRVAFGNKELEIDEEQGTVQMRDHRGYAATRSVNLGKAELVARAAAVLRALGVRDDETNTSAHGLMRKSKDLTTDAPARVDRVAEKLLVKRVIGGYPVEGDKLILSFASDGSIRKIAGRWRKLSYDKSRLTAKLNKGQTSERALARIDEQAQQDNLVVSDGEPVVVRTRLVPKPTGVPGEYALVPVARVDVPIVKPGGSTTVGLDFDL